MFDSLTVPQTRPFVWTTRVLIFAIVALVAFELMASYRAYYQVRGLELTAPLVLVEGSVVNASVVTSGRTWVDVEVDLIQGEHAERLFSLFVQKNKLGFFDPRTQQATQSFTLTRETLSRFQPGSARLRSVATGRLKWAILAPPTVQEIEVEITK